MAFGEKRWPHKFILNLTDLLQSLDLFDLDLKRSYQELSCCSWRVWLCQDICQILMRWRKKRSKRLISSIHIRASYYDRTNILHMTKAFMKSYLTFPLILSQNIFSYILDKFRYMYRFIIQNYLSKMQLCLQKLSSPIDSYIYNWLVSHYKATCHFHWQSKAE